VGREATARGMGTEERKKKDGNGRKKPKKERLETRGDERKRVEATKEGGRRRSDHKKLARNK